MLVITRASGLISAAINLSHNKLTCHFPWYTQQSSRVFLIEFVCPSLGLHNCKLVTMTSLSMKMCPALFCGILALLILNNAVTPVHSVPPPAEVTSPGTASSAAAAAAAVSTSISSTYAVLPLNSTDKTRTATEKPFAHSVSVSGTERPATHKDLFSTATTASEHEVTITDETISTAFPKSESSSSPNSAAVTTATKAPALTSGQQPRTNNSTDASSVPSRNLTTIFPKTDPQTPENITAFTVTPKPPALTSSLPPISNNSSSENSTSAKTITTASTMLPENSSKGMATTTSIQETTLSASTMKSSQNITNKEYNQSTTATTELPAFTENATTGSTLVDHTKTTENTNYFSTTTPEKNQSTTGTTSFSNISTTIAEIPPTNASILVTTNATQGGWIPVITKVVPTDTPNSTTVTEAQPCSSIGVAKQCLIVIAILAVVATIFIISTIALCTKLSSRKYKLKRQQRGTEMTCISSLLRERSNPSSIRYTRQRSPVPNGVLVIHNCDDSDDEAGDNLTLSSFLPENDRYV